MQTATFIIDIDDLGANYGKTLLWPSYDWDDIFSQCTIFQVSAINNINAMLAQATSSIRNENESLLAGKSEKQKNISFLLPFKRCTGGSKMAHSKSAGPLGWRASFFK